MRGFTTQNWVSWRIRSLASALRRAVTATPFWSARNLMRVTRPTSTLSTLITVLFTSMPSALSISKVISGPVLRIFCIKSQPPAKRAISGMSHTTEVNTLVLRTRAGTGWVGGWVLSVISGGEGGKVFRRPVFCLLACFIPNQAGVEKIGRKHG